MLTYTLTPRVTAFCTCRDTLGMWQSGAGEYGGFNITHYCGDDTEHVKACRKALACHLEIPDRQIILPRQTHTANVHTLALPFDEEEYPDFETISRADCLQETDALVTNIPQYCIGVSTADCVPILLFDTRQEVVAAVHAGWRGMQQRIPENAVRAMCHDFGTKPSDILAVVGPSIGPQSFEVGDEVCDAFADAHFPMDSITLRRCKWHIDLWAAAAIVLEGCDIPLAQIQVSGIDTYTDERFFSARRQGINSGRIFTGIMLG